MTKPPPVFDPAEASESFFRHGHTGWLGMKYSAHGDDWVELELPWREDLLGDPERGVLASGPIISLMDMASGMSIWQVKQQFALIATLDLRVDYQRPTRERSSVWGRVECYRTTKSASFVRGIAHDGNLEDPVAHVAGVFMTIGKYRNPADVPESVQAGSAAGTGDE
ncbi:PaaI family thioesterase [Erythrobacter ani]|uniref:PaaI family thioesterase n=1 Tax=Erythrobacter ani TaxID=2827235 RepID=A0ABS6SI43_9SPHN|nr:PaaI family thioesterase [Erythrobacter ani]MBV7264680.1 PaaI family thioesterase [Erythrobacter ani]